MNGRQSEWDAFEHQFWDEAERALARAPGDAAMQEQADHWRRWRGKIDGGTVLGGANRSRSPDF